MFKVKLTIAIIVLGLGAGLSGGLYINSLESAGIDGQKVLLQQADQTVDAFLAQKSVSRGLLANSLQNSRIPIYLSTLHIFYKEMKEMEANEWKVYPNRDDASSKGRAKMVSDTDLPDRFLADLQQKLSLSSGTLWLDAKEKDTFLKKERDRFVKCASIGVDQCVWDYTYNNYGIFSINMTEKYDIALKSRVILIDKDGFGVADSQDPKWSHVKDYTLKHHLVKKAMTQKTVFEGLDLISGEYHAVLAAPLTYMGQVVGVVEVGDPLDEALLGQWQKLVGISSVVVVNGKVAASNMDAKQVGKITHANGDALITSKGDVNLYGKNSKVWIKKSYKVSKGQKEKVEIYLVKDTEALTSGFASAKLYYSLILLVLILLAIGFVASFYKEFITPFETIDQGLHEIVNGNADYEFPYDFKDKLANTLSNSLNLTIMVLQGKPLPDEDGQEGWGDDDISDTSRLSVDLSQVEKAALLKEPRDKYFERLFKEFIKAKGDPDNTRELDFNRFVQKIIRNENKFKTRLDAKEIRMVVVIKGKEVGLYPVAYTAEDIRNLSSALW